MGELINITDLNITDLSAYASSISMAEFYNTIKPVALYILGMVVYAVFIFKFYRFIARKEVFRLGLSSYSRGEGFFSKLFASFLYIAEYVLLFPIFSFFWFSVMSLLFIFISKNQGLNYILLVSMVLVAVIRISAYYNEDLSKDLAKMIPFALLGIFLIDVSYFSVSSSIATLKSIPSMWKIILYYLLAIIALEFVLRVAYSIAKVVSGSKEAPQEEETLEQPE
jgi:hypothetical protein